MNLVPYVCHELVSRKTVTGGLLRLSKEVEAATHDEVHDDDTDRQ